MTTPQQQNSKDAKVPNNGSVGRHEEPRQHTETRNTVTKPPETKAEPGLDMKATDKPFTDAELAEAEKVKTQADSAAAGVAGAQAQATAAAAATAEKKARVASKVFIVTGPVQEFANVGEAEKFLNAEGAPQPDFSVIKGNRIQKKQKVSLR